MLKNCLFGYSVRILPPQQTFPKLNGTRFSRWYVVKLYHPIKTRAPAFGHKQCISSARESSQNIHLIAIVSDKPGTLELHELSLVFHAGELSLFRCA